MSKARCVSLRRQLMAGLAIAAVSHAVPALADNWNPTLDGVGRAGSGQGSGALDLMVPLYQDGSTLLLADALGGLDSDSAKAAAFGLVLRHRFEAGFILGGYAFGDFQRSSAGTAFPQVVAGLEFKTADWDLHATGYVPFQNVETLQSVAPQAGMGGMLGPGELVIDGDRLLLRHDSIGASPGIDGWRLQEAALYGGEGAIGWRLPLDRALGQDIDANLYLGGYVFGRDGFDTYAGPEARLELQVHDLAFLGDGSRLTASLETSWDDPRGLQGAGLLRLRIPLGSLFGLNERHETDRLDRRMVDPVQRDLIALTDQRREVLPAPDAISAAPFDETVRDAETDRTIALVYFADGGAAASSGSAADPTSLADAVGSKGITGNSATDALIVVSGEAGPIAGNVALAGNQILLGGGSTLAVLGNTTNEMATFNPTAFDASASRPTINHDGTADQGAIGATGVDHVKLVGLDIGIGTQGAPGFVTYYGVALTDSSHDIVRDVTVTGGDAAFLLDAEMAAVDDTLLQDIAVTGTGFGVFIFSGGAGGNRVSNLTVDTASFDALATPMGGPGSRAFYADAVAGQTSNTIALNGITVTNTQFGGTFDQVAGLAIDGWTGTGADSSSSSSVGLLVSNGSGLSLQDFSFTGYRAGVQVMNNGGGNSIDGSTRGIIADIGTNAASGTTGLFLSKSDVTVDSVAISGVGSLANVDFALQINGAANVRITDVSIDGQNSGGGNVTDHAVFLSGTVATDDIDIQAGSTGNSAVNVGDLCFQVLGPASVTGSIGFTTPAASCP